MKKGGRSNIIWPTGAPEYVTNTTIINGSDHSGYTLITKVYFRETCSKGQSNHRVELTLTDWQNQNFLSDTLTEPDPDFPAWTNHKTSRYFTAKTDPDYELSGTISVDYNSGSVYFDGNSKLSHQGIDFLLTGIVIMNWFPPLYPVPELPPHPVIIPAWYPNVESTLDIVDLHIITKTNSLGSQPQITVEVKGPSYCPESLILTPDQRSAQKYFNCESGDESPGLNSNIIADLDKGCVYFDADYHLAFLRKPKKEETCWPDYEIACVKILDWFGKALPSPPVKS